MKNEENSEKLLALEIEHLKSTNIMENQKIEELKLDYEKSEASKDYLTKETEELNEKLTNTENENKQKQITFKIKKESLEEKLKNIKNQISTLRKSNQKDINIYSSIENDIKNKISFISLQNNNIIDKYPLNDNMDDSQTNFIEKSAIKIKEDKNVETKELLEFLNNNNIKNIDDLQKKFLNKKRDNQNKENALRDKQESSSNEENSDENNLKNQIMSIMSQIKK
jgi:hypothetical protein